jgi:ribonuclease VapC
MTRIVLDASAVLALLHQEPGYKMVEQHLPNGLLSVVNLAEVIAVLEDTGMPHKEAVSTVTELIKEIMVFDQPQACLAANLRKSSKSYGLSLGDRACLALAEIQNAPVLTADKAWSKLNNHPVKIIVIH